MSKQKAFFIILKELSVAKNCLSVDSAPLINICVCVIFFFFCKSTNFVDVPINIHGIFLHSSHRLIVYFAESRILNFLEVLHLDVSKLKKQKKSIGAIFFNMISKFERFFINFADFRPFSEAMKCKKINDKCNLRGFILFKSLSGNSELI